MTDIPPNGNLGGFARAEFQLSGDEDESLRQQLVAAAQEISRQRTLSRSNRSSARDQLRQEQARQQQQQAIGSVLGVGPPGAPTASISPTNVPRSSEGFLEAQRQLISEQLRTGQGENIRILTPNGEVTPLDDNFQSTLSALYGDDQGDIEAFQQGIEELNADVKPPGYRELYGRGSPPDTLAASALAGTVDSALDGYYAQAAANIDNEFNARQLLLSKFATEGIADPLQADLGNAIQVNRDYLAARGQDLDLSEIDAIVEASNQTALDSEEARRNIAQSYATQVGEVLPLIRQQRIEETDAAFQAARSGDPAALKRVGVPDFIIDQLAQEEKDIAEREAALQEQRDFTQQEFRRLRSYAASGDPQDAAIVANIDEILTGRAADGETNPAASREERYRDTIASIQAQIDALPSGSRISAEDKAAAEEAKRDLEDSIRLITQILGVDEDGFPKDVAFRPELLDEGALDILDVQRQAFGVGNTLARSIGAVAAGAPLTRQGLNPTPRQAEGDEG